MSVHICIVFPGQGGNGARSYYHGPPPDPKSGLENQSNKEASRIQPHEQDMELGFEDNSLPMSFEGLERKFFDEVMKLAKEQSDAEDVENARHREVRLALKQISRLFGLAFPL
jgi:hypothetical protein